MQVLAAALDAYFNPQIVEFENAERVAGFVLLTFKFGTANGTLCNYISNGATRRDIAKMFREMAERLEGGERSVS